MVKRQHFGVPFNLNFKKLCDISAYLSFDLISLVVVMGSLTFQNGHVTIITSPFGTVILTKEEVIMATINAIKSLKFSV